jgi:5-methylcytosine-specific restriction endonuclease McrA
MTRFLNERGYSRLPFLIDDIIDYFHSKVSTKYFGLSKNARIALLRKRNFKCCYCSKKLTLKTMTVEHIEPRSFGGSDDEDNLDIACAQCNEERGNKPLIIKDKPDDEN